MRTKIATMDSPYAKRDCVGMLTPIHIVMWLHKGIWIICRT